MDKFDFMSMVDDIFDECESKEEMDSRKKQMIEIVNQMYEQKLGFAQTMGLFEGKSI